MPVLISLKLEVISGKETHHRLHQINMSQHLVLKDFDLTKTFLIQKRNYQTHIFFRYWSIYSQIRVLQKDMCCLCKSLCYSLFLIKLFLTYINLLFILCLPVTDENGYFITSTSFNDKLKKKNNSVWHVFYFIHSHKLLQRNMLQLLSCSFVW